MVLVRNGPFRALARAARRSLYRRWARGIPIVYDARYQRGVFGVPMDPLRGEKVLGALEEAGLLKRDLLSEPRPASLQNLLRVHTPEYLHAVQEPEALIRILGVDVLPAEAEATLDLHDGNGTRRIFADDPTVHTFSIHNDHWGETEAVASTSIALGGDVEDALFLGTLRGALPPVFEAVKPGLVVYLAGTDPAADDPLGNWRLSRAAKDRKSTRLNSSHSLLSRMPSSA